MENLQTSFKKVNWKVSGRLFGFGTSPEADWKIIFVSGLTFALLLIVLSIFMFIKIDKGEIFVVEKIEGENEKTLDIARLQETVSYYQNKAVEFERIKAAKVSAVDPSL
ncbi:MAG: hypothetical protein WAX80_02050 [Minisyncoccia bacterium]